MYADEYNCCYDCQWRDDCGEYEAMNCVNLTGYTEEEFEKWRNMGKWK